MNFRKGTTITKILQIGKKHDLNTVVYHNYSSAMVNLISFFGEGKSHSELRYNLSKRGLGMITTMNYKKENGQDFPLQGRKNSGPGFALGQVKIIQWASEIRLGRLVSS